MEAAPAHRLDSTEPDIPGPVAQCEEAPAPDLTTTSHPEPSSQGDTALSPTTNTQCRSLKRPVTNFRTSVVCRFRSPRRVLVQVEEADPSHRLDLQDTKPELEPVPAAQDEDDLENDVEVLELEHHRPGETAPNRKGHPWRYGRGGGSRLSAIRKRPLMCMCVRMYVCLHTYVRVYVYMCFCMYMHVFMCVSVYMYVHKCVWYVCVF
ncbi:uncharacterized protein LOC111192730 isoform X1 [Astyanax mexicanus]|uniref:uncharacterized protein LOC111192730 isoform X1 n=1 Tax=Astyanax mexicanus TaxID=7994 RepID=UPI0020CADDAC|nr:uncharacterized protein LOC111192730 isoform X1 [Astyanax mexicanus]